MIEFFEDTAGGLEVVVALGECPEVDGSADAAHALIGEAVEDLSDAGDDECTGAHGAGLFGDVEGAFVEAPVADGVGGLGDGEDFGVGGGIVGAARLVVGGGDDLAFVLDDGSDGDFVFFPGFNGFVVGEGHVVGLVAIEGGGVDFFKWAFECLHYFVRWVV